jgi:hypothetical protein
VLNSLAQKYSETYEPKGKQAQTLDSHFAAIKRAVVAGKARHEKKRNRSETPTPSALALLPPPQSAIPGELVQAITNIAQMAQLAQSAAEAKRPRTEDTDASFICSSSFAAALSISALVTAHASNSWLWTSSASLALSNAIFSTI